MESLEYIKKQICYSSNILTENDIEEMLKSFCREYKEFDNDLKLNSCICVKENISTDNFEIFYILVIGFDYYYMIEVDENSCILIECNNKVCYFPVRSGEKWE